MSRTKLLLEDIHSGKLNGNRKVVFEYALKNRWIVTRRNWTMFNSILAANGVEPVKLATARTLRALGLTVPEEPDIEVENPHYKNAGQMKLYVLNN